MTLATLAAFTHTSTERVAMVENATSGVQAVLNSLPFQHGDQILLTDSSTQALDLVARFLLEPGDTVLVDDLVGVRGQRYAHHHRLGAGLAATGIHGQAHGVVLVVGE